MKTLKSTLIFLLFFQQIFAQKSNKLLNRIINEKEVTRIIKALSSDDMRGRNALQPADIGKASTFIENELKQIGLKPMKGLDSFRQEFPYTEIQQLFRNGQKDTTIVHTIMMANIVGVLEGKSKKEEMVIFSGHYDHLGIQTAIGGDSIANGADDDASGITAVIELARYFKKINKNERTIVFIAFTAEEIGGFGSRHFSQHVDNERVIAMFNIEMIGKPSKWGENSAFITGFERSDFGQILQRNLKDTKFEFHPDPYPSENLFYRSDNATLARLGVPAHSISTDQIDSDKLYHSVNDEFESLEVSNITATIRAIALSSKSIISGEDTPKRINKTKVK